MKAIKPQTENPAFSIGCTFCSCPSHTVIIKNKTFSIIAGQASHFRVEKCKCSPFFILMTLPFFTQKTAIYQKYFRQALHRIIIIGPSKYPHMPHSLSVFAILNPTTFLWSHPHCLHLGTTLYRYRSLALKVFPCCWKHSTYLYKKGDHEMISNCSSSQRKLDGVFKLTPAALVPFRPIKQSSKNCYPLYVYIIIYCSLPASLPSCSQQKRRRILGRL